MSFIVRGGRAVCRRTYPSVPSADSPASYEWAIAMQPSRPSLGIYPRLLLFGRIPVRTYIDAVFTIAHRQNR